MFFLNEIHGQKSAWWNISLHYNSTNYGPDLFGEAIRKYLALLPGLACTRQQLYTDQW